MKKYQIIYADPPWNFKAWGKTGKKAPQNHYPCMANEQIYNLNIKGLANDNCALFLWATYPLLQEALETIRMWDFKYRTVAFTWVKTTKNDKYHMGLGYWTRANPEICLIATRGVIKRINAGVRNLQIIKKRAHSQKPDEIRGEIVNLLGDLPRIELFAREKTEGWDVWGNEVESDIDLEAL